MTTGIHHVKHVFLLGIGGIGMSALARYFRASGRDVCGYDKTPTELTSELISEGIPVHFDDNPDLLPEFLSGEGVNPDALIIYTPAIPKGHREMNLLRERGYQLYKRSQVLGLLTRSSRTIAVAGTHGKTTTSSMIAHILRDSGTDCTAFLGGISRNYSSNLLLGSGDPASEWIVVEADEYDRSFLTLYPSITVVTSLDADHLDIYGSRESMIASYSEFAGQTAPEGKLICRQGLDLGKIMAAKWTYSITGESDFKGTDIAVVNHQYRFNIYHGNQDLGEFLMTWPGRHNVENAVAACAATVAAGVPVPAIKKALETFAGVKRRFDYQIRSPKVTFIDDYAHHPEELRATIESVRELYPGKKLLGVFQPHLYTRTRDFAEGFSASLSLLDEVILLDIYPARELPIAGVTSEMILSGITSRTAKICARGELIQAIMDSDANVILTLGAGDIDQLVEPVRNALMTKYTVQPV